LNIRKDLQEILPKLRKLRPYIYKEYKVNLIEIFGLYIRNEQNYKSDLDLLVSFLKAPILLKFIELRNFLSDQLQVKVDLVMKDVLKPRIGKNILNESILI